MILQETYTLADGVEIPKIGLGTWFIDDGDGTIHVDSPTEGLQWDSMVREVFHVEATALTSADRGQLILDFSLPPDAANH